MTDQHEPESRTSAPGSAVPDRGMPTAGRRPDAPGAAPRATEPSGERDEVPDGGATDELPDSGATDELPDSRHAAPFTDEPGPAPGSRRPVGEGPTVRLRRPPPAAPQGADPDEPTMITPPLTGERPAADPDGSTTARLTPPAVDDEPTVEARLPVAGSADEEGETVRLRPPAVVPGARDRPGPRDQVEAESGGTSTSRPDDGSLPDPAGAGPEVGGTQTAGTPADATPADATPADATPAGATPAGATPPGATPASGASPGAASAGAAPAGATPVGESASPPAAKHGEQAAGEQGAGRPLGSVGAVNAAEAAGTVESGEAAGVPENGVDLGGTGGTKSGRKPRLSSAGALIWVLLALFGFTLVVQLRSNSADDGLASARQEDLVRILSDLEARDQRLQAEINTLEQSQRQLTSGVEGRQAALAEASKRAGELGLLAGTVPGRGPGLRVVIDPKDQVKASAILNAVQELRGAGGEVMQIDDPSGVVVRIVASTYFVDAEGGGIAVDGNRLTGPYTLWVIGVPQTMQTALQIPGGVVASVNSAGGSVTMEARAVVEVTAVRQAVSLQYARPVS